MTPQLRFPGFTDDWQVKKLGDIAELTSSKRVYLSDYVPRGIPFYRGKEITELKKNKKPKDILYISNDAYEGFKKRFGAPRKNEILITAVGTLGNILRIRDDESFYFKDGNLIWLKDIVENPYFTEILLENSRRKLLRSSIGSSQQALTIVGLKKITLSFPGKDEQQKIAGFLTAVDERVELQEKRVELLKQYKKGAMQKIFTQKIRFKDENGNPYPDWEERLLGEVSEFINGYTFLSSTYNDGGKYKVITIANVQQGAMDAANANRVSLLPSNIQSSQILNIGDILISMTGNVGRVCLVDEENCLLNQRVGKLVPKNINEGYLYHVINSPHFISKMISSGQGGAQDNLSSKDIKNYRLRLPVFEEQKKIADFLSAIDDKIELENKKLQQAKQFKKSLLQKMFV